ncbi:MAG: hypothetical protein U0105_11140 [Candidatus Obscuribacterales bacterium]
MSLEEKHELLRKASVIITMGVGILSTIVFYPLIPQPVRVLGVPLWMLFCYFIGNQVVKRVITARLELEIEGKAAHKDRLAALSPAQRRVFVLRASRAVFLGVGAVGVVLAYPLITHFPAWIAAAQVFYFAWCLSGLATDIILRNWVVKE